MSMVSLVIPVYNEATRIPTFYQTLIKNAKEHPFHYECIFIDNGSHDNSLAILKDICEKDYHFHYISTQQNMSVIGTLYIGSQYAQGDIIVMMDLNHPAYMINEFYKIITKQELPYIGGLLRKSTTSKDFGKQRFFKAYTRDCLQSFFDEADYDGFRSFIKHNHSDMIWIPYTDLEKQEVTWISRTIKTLNYRFGRSFLYTFVITLLFTCILLPLILIIFFDLDASYSFYISTLLSICIVLLIEIIHSRMSCIHILKKMKRIQDDSTIKRNSTAQK